MYTKRSANANLAPYSKQRQTYIGLLRPLKPAAPNRFYVQLPISPW